MLGHTGEHHVPVIPPPCLGAPPTSSTPQCWILAELAGGGGQGPGAGRLPGVGLEVRRSVLTAWLRMALCPGVREGQGRWLRPGPPQGQSQRAPVQLEGRVWQGRAGQARPEPTPRCSGGSSSLSAEHPHGNRGTWTPQWTLNPAYLGAFKDARPPPPPERVQGQAADRQPQGRLHTCPGAGPQAHGC